MTARLIITTLTLSLGGLAVASCSASADRAQLPEIGDETIVPVVEVVTVALGSVDRPVRATGSTAPVRAANLTPEITATIQEIYVSEGDRVELDQPLVRLNSRVARLQASQASARAEAARAQAKQLALDHERLATLAEAGVVGSSKAQQIGSQLDAVRSQHAAAVSAVQLTRHVVSNGILRAPFAGTIALVRMEVGELVTKMPPAVFARLVDLSRVEVRVRATEAQLQRVTVGDPATATILDSSLTGEVTFVGVEVHPLTRTGEVVTTFDNEDRRIRGGMFAQLEIAPAGDRRALVLPRSALDGTDDDPFVYIVDESCHARRRPVSIELLDAGRFEVRDGLEVGREVVTRGVARLVDGILVELQPRCSGANTSAESDNEDR